MSRKTFIVLMVLCAALALSAFAIVPAVNYSVNGEREINVSFPQTAEMDNDVLTVYANYDSYGEDFEIAKDITVYSDSNSANELEFKSLDVEDGMYKYEFNTVEQPSRVYIEAPVIYVPTEIETRAYAVNGAETVHSTLSNDTPWIRVSDISTEVKNSIQYIMVHVEGDHGTMIPRSPELVISGIVYSDLMSSVTFDDDMNFESADFVFGIPASEGKASVDILDVSELRVSNAMTKAIPDVASTYTSSIAVATAIQ